MAQIKRVLGISGMNSEVCAWSGNGGQIDLIINRNDQVINLCEMKYTSAPFKLTKAYYEKMSSRRELFREQTRTRKALHLKLVTTYPLPHTTSIKMSCPEHHPFQKFSKAGRKPERGVSIHGSSSRNTAWRLLSSRRMSSCSLWRLLCRMYDGIKGCAVSDVWKEVSEGNKTHALGGVEARNRL